jgi:type I restriction enzyme, S subunit
MSQPWPIFCFADILDRVERRFVIDDTETYRCIGVRWYGQGAFIRQQLSGVDIARKGQWRIEPGDVVYNKLFAWKGAFAVANETVKGCIVSDKFPTYRVDFGRVDPAWFKWYFRTASIARQAQDLSKGAAAISKLTLNPPDFWRLTIPLPALHEQKRIVVRIDKLAAKIEEARTLRQHAAAEALLDAGRQSLIGEAPKEDWIPLSTFVAEIENGKSPACEPRPANLDEWGVLKVGAVSFGTFDERENKALPPDHPRDPSYEVKAGDFLMSRANTTELVGACAIVGEARPRLLLSDKTLRFHFKQGAEILPAWLNHVMKSPALREQIAKAASGTSPTMKNISKEKVFRLLVPPKSEPEQRRIVAYLDDLEAKVDALMRLQGETAAELDALLPSILDKAFKGEL